MAIVPSTLPPLTLFARAADTSSSIYGAGNGDEAMKNLDDLTDKLFRVKKDDDQETIEDEAVDEE